MSITEGEFKTIPDHVTPENRKKILELAVANEKEVSDVECCEYLIRHWNETIEDGNLLYNDREYARSRGFKRHHRAAGYGDLYAGDALTAGLPPSSTRRVNCCTSSSRTCSSFRSESSRTTRRSFTSPSRLATV